MNRRLLRVALIVSICAVSGASFAQPHIRVPELSPRAAVEETFGVTDVRVDYHRPAVKGRKIFGGLVPHDVIWRAGANEPTSISFSTPVKVEGQDVPPGTYDLYLIPAEGQWTLILSRFAGGWGTYSYDPSEDLMRARITPQSGEMQEQLVYTFDDATNDAVTLTLRWDKVRVPVKIEADTKTLVADGIKRDLRGAWHWEAAAYTEAASYMLSNGNPDLALEYIDRANMMSPTSRGYRVKAAILDKKGDAEGAKALRAKADVLLSPEIAPVMNAYRLMSQKKYDEAISSLGKTTSWRGLVAIGDAWNAKGDKAKAMELYEKAMSAAPNQSDKTEVQDSINALGAEGKS